MAEGIRPDVMKELKHIYPAQVVKYRPPVNLRSGDEHLFGNADLSYRVPASFLVRIGRAWVTDRGIIIRNFRALSRFVICYDFDFRRYRFRYLLSVLLRKRRVAMPAREKYFLAFDNYSGPAGFAHWILDGVTRLVEMGSSLQDYTVLIPAYFSDYSLYEETLSLFAIGKVARVPEGSYAAVRDLYAATPLADSGCFVPENISKLRSFVWSKLGVNRNEAPAEMIYISRAGAARRHVVNEEAVSALMRKHGFTIVRMEALSFPEQVRLIARARCVVSIHGAALTHIAFMHAGCSVLELRRRNDRANNMYLSLASCAGVKYYYQQCEGVEIAGHANSFNLGVDIAELERTISLMKRNGDA